MPKPAAESAVPSLGDHQPAYTVEQMDLLRGVDRLRKRLRHSPRMTEVLEMLKGMGYRRLPPDLVKRYDRGELVA